MSTLPRLLRGNPGHSRITVHPEVGNSVAGLSLLPLIYFRLVAKSGARKCGVSRSLNLLIAYPQRAVRLGAYLLQLLVLFRREA